MAKIVLVDDRPESRELLRTLCAHKGHETREASDGAEALDLVRADPPDLVITDVLMPTMDGYELVRRLKEKPETARVSVIFCTAHYLGPEARALAERSGVRIVLTKPIEPETLFDALDRVLNEAPATPGTELAFEALDREHLRLVTDELSRKANELRASNEKLTALMDLSLKLSTERDPDRLLEGFCSAARSLVGARYAGAAAWNRAGSTRVDRWCAFGLTPESRAALSVPVKPSNFVALMTDEASGRTSGSSEGLPGGHPPVSSLVVAPVLSMQRDYGWVYLADKIGFESFTEEDERLVRILAKQLGRIYENGKLYAEVETHAQELEQEVADRRRSERMLAERERQLSALFESAIDAMIVTDDEGHIVEANPAATDLFGLPREQLLGRTAEEFAERGVDVPKMRERFIRQGKMSGEFRLVRPDGKARELDFRATASFLPGRHLSVLRDVTDKKRLEERLRHTLKMEAIGHLAGGIAHDFNNLLTVITGYTDLLLSDLSSDDRHYGLVSEIKSAGDRSAALTQQLLAFGRRQVLSPVVVDLNEVIGSLERLLQRIIGEDVRLTTRLSPSLGRCKVDPAQIEQVVMNLAVNSRDAMPEGGHLSIETRNVELEPNPTGEVDGPKPGRYVLLAVSDEGVGMDEETLSRLFEPFFTTKAPGNGTGLGLATVYGIVKQSGGHITADSAPGRGATFNIYLPRTDAPLTREKTSRQAAERGTETILLVEDDDAVRRLAERILSRLGYAVVEAASCEDALARLESHEGTIDLLCTDVVMPDGSGRDLAERITERRKGTKVLFMSGYTDNAIGEHGILAEDVVFLQKPFTAASLSRKVREALRQGPR